MILIREYFKGGIDADPKCVIRASTYASSFAHIQMLATAAQQDFPALAGCDIEVVHYGGQRIARTFGIEFVPPGKVPAIYEVVPTLEPTL